MPWLFSTTAAGAGGTAGAAGAGTAGAAGAAGGIGAGLTTLGGTGTFGGLGVGGSGAALGGVGSGASLLGAAAPAYGAGTLSSLLGYFQHPFALLFSTMVYTVQRIATVAQFKCLALRWRHQMGQQQQSSQSQQSQAACWHQKPILTTYHLPLFFQINQRVSPYQNCTT